MIILKSFMVGCVALVCALVLIFSLVPLFGEPFQTSMFVSAVIGCYTIGMPVSYYCFRQAEHLREALDELEGMHAELAERAARDHMTGMLNRENFFTALEQRRRSTDRGMLLIIDIDRFKRINDDWGHLIGDEALIKVSEAILQTVRAGDIAGRIGGEEFAVYLSGANAGQAEYVAERIREAVEAIEFRPAEGFRLQLSVSIGGSASYTDALMSDIVRMADRRLYEAKRQGRNRAVVADPAPRAA